MLRARITGVYTARERRTAMSKLNLVFPAAMLALSCTVYVSAADDPRPTNEQKLQEQLQEQKGSAQEPAKQQTTGDLTKEEQEYLSALKKCESMSGSDKQQCVDRTRKEYGHK
jgi:hypothetical protein